MATLAKVRKITRGPKPVRRLRSLGLQPDLAAEPPTTAGLHAPHEQDAQKSDCVTISEYVHDTASR